MEERFVGAILLHALGDAICAPFEGLPSNSRLSKEQILFRKELKFTDDTLMAIHMAKAIIKTGDFNAEEVAKEYLNWFLSGDLRGIGVTTYAALSSLTRGVDFRKSGIVSRWAAGNGVAMRVTPIALLDAFRPLDELYEHVRADAYITHRNELAISGALAVALGIRYSLRVNDKQEVVDRAIEALLELGIDNRVKDAIESAREKASEKGNHLLNLLDLGVSGYVVHTVGAAYYVFLTFDDPLEAFILLARAGGDTDTNAAVAGALLGAFHGAKSAPNDILDRLERKAELEDIGKKLYQLALKFKKSGDDESAPELSE